MFFKWNLLPQLLHWGSVKWWLLGQWVIFLALLIKPCRSEKWSLMLMFLFLIMWWRNFKIWVDETFDSFVVRKSSISNDSPSDMLESLSGKLSTTGSWGSGVTFGVQVSVCSILVGAGGGRGIHGISGSVGAMWESVTVLIIWGSSQIYLCAQTHYAK